MEYHRLGSPERQRNGSLRRHLLALPKYEYLGSLGHHRLGSLEYHGTGMRVQRGNRRVRGVIYLYVSGTVVFSKLKIAGSAPSLFFTARRTLVDHWVL